jgi:ATP-binding cassette, subfamily B, bacterial PglK
MKIFWKQFSYLLDREDKKRFCFFIFLLFIGGLLSLLGIGAVIPFVKVLVSPDKINYLSVLGGLTYVHAVGLCVVVLILSFWIKDMASILILKWQTVFLNNLMAKIRKKLFSCYIYSPYIYQARRSSSDLINNINIESQFLSGYVMAQVGNVLNEVVTSFVVFIALVFINPVFSIIVVGCLLLTAKLFMSWLKERSDYYGKLRAKSYADLTRSVAQGLGGVKETKIYQKEAYFVAEVDAAADKIAKSASFAAVFSQTPRFLIEAVAIAVVLITLFCFVLVGYTGTALLVLLSIFGVAAVQLLPSMNRLMQALTMMRYGYPALDKIYHEIKKIDAEKVEKVQYQAGDMLQFKKTISLSNISFSYLTNPVLNNIDLVVRRGEKVAFVGTSGAGKTTLVDVILGVLQPGQGEIYVDDVQITKNNLGAWQRNFGYIPQMIYIYDCSLRENIAFGLDAENIDDERVWYCLDQAALSNFVREECEQGLDTLVGENGVRLSGGQRQRIGIARALYYDPNILVMDEATAALDNQTEYEVTQALSNVGKDRTIITIAHRLTTIQNYDTIFVMDQGKVIDSGNYEHLLDKCSVFKKMVEISQRKEGV